MNKEKLPNIIEWIICIIIALVIALLFRYYIGTPTIVKQPSMYPTLKENQRLWLNRWGRTTKKIPQRGDIITFEAPSTTFLTEKDINKSVNQVNRTYNFNGFKNKNNLKQNNQNSSHKVKRMNLNKDMKNKKWVYLINLCSMC